MVTTKKKRFIFTLTESYFGYKFKWADLFLPASYNGLRKDVNEQFYFGVKTHTKTVVLLLEKPIEEIHANFSTSHKRYIKKATAEGVQCYFNNDRKGFIEFYNDFAKSKKLYTLDPNRLEEFKGEEWKYSYAVLNGQLLVAHSYLEDKEAGIVRLMQSGSLRLKDNYDTAKIAHANKLLHYYDIKFFKERGLREYDFGNWDGLAGLLEFKQAFGAQQTSVFNYFTYPFILKDNLRKFMKYLKK